MRELTGLFSCLLLHLTYLCLLALEVDSRLSVCAKSVWVSLIGALMIASFTNTSAVWDRLRSSHLVSRLGRLGVQRIILAELAGFVCCECCAVFLYGVSTPTWEVWLYDAHT